MDEPPCKIGDEIVLVFMGNDPCPIPPGTRGRVRSVNKLLFCQSDRYQIMVDWQIERSLMLVWPADQFRVVPHAAS
ncbi:DUF4314 domain-containing protein [Ancylobacter rudongensis]|uniref:Uncharacterized protein n=1 Tax=Ancylobacter rudongensis TaxID=177413 RepID=A0A1G4URA1_9HYPH|nr:DUF4314 domain-containing protein [Ancylobacter rudongensis]SCW95349.1 hypothetical protein SAMN05660859_0003 [Ancylobacter rudongensis]